MGTSPIQEDVSNLERTIIDKHQLMHFFTLKTVLV